MAQPYKHEAAARRYVRLLATVRWYYDPDIEKSVDQHVLDIVFEDLPINLHSGGAAQHKLESQP